jgi:hypothetical protein
LYSVLSNRIAQITNSASVCNTAYLFPDIKKVQLQNGAYVPSAKPWHERKVCHENLYYWNIQDLMESYEAITNKYEVLLVTMDATLAKYTFPGIIATMTDSILNAIDVMISVVNQPRGEVRSLPPRHVNTVVCHIADILLNSLLILKTHSRNIPNFGDFASKYARQAQLHNSPGLSNYYPPVFTTVQDFKNHAMEQLRTQLPPRFISGFPQDLIVRIASYFCTLDTDPWSHSWSHYRTHGDNINPPERCRKYKQRIVAWRDLCNFMSTCKLIQTAIQYAKIPFDYDIIRERLIIEHMWQSWHTLQECSYIPPPQELEVYGAPPPPYDPRDERDDINDIENGPPHYLRHRWVTERLFKKQVTILAAPIGAPLDPRNYPSLYPQLNPDDHNIPQLKPYDTKNHDTQLDDAELYCHRIQRYLRKIGSQTPEQQQLLLIQNSISPTSRLEEEEQLRHLYNLHDSLPIADNYEYLQPNMEAQALQANIENERVNNEILEYETLTQQSLPYCQHITCNGDCTTCTEMHIARDIGYEQGLQKSTNFLTTADFQTCSTDSARLLHAYNLGLQDAQQQHLERDNSTIIPPEQHYNALQLQQHHNIHRTQSVQSMDSDEQFRRASAERQLAFWHQNSDSDEQSTSSNTTRKKKTSHRSTQMTYDSDNDTKPPARKSPKSN